MTTYIEWRGEILAQVGYGIQARRILDVLYDRGVQIKLIPAEDYIPEANRITDPKWLARIEQSKAMPPAPIRINYCIPPVAEYSQTAFNVIYAMWETDKYPREWIQKINQSHLFIAGCPSLVNSARKAGVNKPIEWLYPPIDRKLWSPGKDKIDIPGVDEDTVVFMFIGNWLPRKNFDDLLLAYSYAFSGYKDTMLLIKTWGGNNSFEFKNQLLQNVQNKLGRFSYIDHPKRAIVTDMLPEEQVVKFMRNADFYFSMSHGEGLDLPMVQAMSMGIIPITTRFLAHGDYLDNFNSIEVKHSLTPIVDAGAPYYTTDQMWSRPDVGDAIKKLRSAYKAKKGEAGHLLPKEETISASVDRYFSDKAVGDRAMQILYNIEQAISNAKARHNIPIVR